jgi:seryl-tRNA synthetase
MTSEIKPDFQGLEEEIGMLRGAIRRVMGYLNEAQDLEQMIKVLSSTGLATTRLASALKVQRDLEGGSGEVSQAIRKALEELAEELGLE